MNVLPTAATLGSFFIVLSVVIAITFLLSLPTTTQRISALFTRPHLKINLKANSGQVWAGIQAAIGYYYGYDETAGSLQPLPSAEQRQRLGRGPWITRKFWGLLYSLTDLSLQRSLYGLSLAVKPEASVHYRPTFSFRKCFVDLLIFMLLPLWITLAVLAISLWMLVYLTKACRSGLALPFKRHETRTGSNVPLTAYYPPLETGNINRKLDVALPPLAS